MTRMQEIMDHLTGPNNVNALIGMMAETFEDFGDVLEQYALAMQELKKSLGEEIVNGEAYAIRRQISSDLLFSGFLGIKANLDNYINPIARNFLDVDPDIYLREDLAHRLPEYVDAQKQRDRFYALLPEKQRESYEAVTAYVCYLQTVGPKLAHYYGYLLGNDLLPRVIPGYCIDPVLTMQYRQSLEHYMGMRLPG